MLAQDAIRLAVREVGRDNVFFCVFESNRAILDVLETVPARNILSIRDRALAPFLADFLRAAWYVRSHRIDSVIDMEFFSRASAIFAFLSGAANRVGLHRFTGELPYRGDLMTHRVQYLPHLHIAVQYSILVEARVSRSPDDEPLLKVPLERDSRAPAPAAASVRPDGRRSSQRMRARLAAPRRRPIVLLNPTPAICCRCGSGRPSDSSTLAQARARRLPERLVGSPARRRSAPPRKSCAATLGSPRVVSVAGKTTLRELLTLYTPGRRARHQRQRPRPLRLADAGAHRRAVRSGDAAAVRPAAPATT